jgi:hypothetical protein
MAGDNLTTIIGASLAIIAIVISRYLAWIQADKAQVVIEATHKLVNSAMDAQLRITMFALRRIADLTKDPVDVALAEDAEKTYAERRKK